jgi:hypothetical protein
MLIDTLTRREMLVSGLAIASWAAGTPAFGQQGTSVRGYGARGDGRTDDTDAIQTALDRSSYVQFEPGLYVISDTLRLRSGQTVRLSPGAVIRQIRPGRNAFVALQTRGVSLLLSGGEIAGPGGYNFGARWTDNQGYESFRGIRFVGCTESRVAGPGRIYNWGNAAIDITGGRGTVCEDLTIEGTHQHGALIARLANFQNGIYLANDRRFGACNDVSVRNCTFSGLAQGLLREAIIGAPAPTLPTTVIDCTFHDIPGQHGIYNQDGLFEVRNCRFRNVEGSAVKTQAADAGRPLRRIRASGIEARSLRGALFEIAEVGGYGGWIEDIEVAGTAAGAGYLAAVNGRIIDARITVSGSAVIGNAVYVQGSGCRDVRIVVDAEDIGQDGVLVVARDADLEIEATIRDANRTRILGGSGIRVSSPGARVALVNPRVTDRRRRMMYGVFNEIAGSEIRVRGTVLVRGAADAAVRATGRIVDFPANASLEGRNGSFINRANVVPH